MSFELVMVQVVFINLKQFRQNQTPQYYLFATDCWLGFANDLLFKQTLHCKYKLFCSKI